MGEYADMAIEDGMNADLDPSYESWDEEELGAYTYRSSSRRKNTNIVCRYCGKAGFYWSTLNGKWRLYNSETKELHECLKHTHPIDQMKLL